MEKEKVNRESVEKNVELPLLQKLEELQGEVRLAIAVAANMPYRLMTPEEVCGAMKISRGTLRRYEKMFNIPARKIGRKKFYFEAEIKNCIITGLRLWEQ